MPAEFRIRDLREVLARSPAEAKEVLVEALAQAGRVVRSGSADKKEVIQEVALKCLADQMTFVASGPPDAPLVGWLLGVARNVSANLAAKVAKRNEVERLAAVEEGAASGAGDPADAAEWTEEVWEAVGRVRSAIRIFRQPYRQIAELVLRACSRREISQYLNDWTGVGAVQASKLFRKTVAWVTAATCGTGTPWLPLDKKKSKKSRFERIPPPDPNTYIYGERGCPRRSHARTSTPPSKA